MTRPVVRFPVHLETQYAARLVRRIDVARRLTLEWAPRADAAGDSTAGRWRATIGAVRRAFLSAMPVTAESLTPTAKAVDSFATKTVERIVPVDVTGATRTMATRTQQEALHWHWARENVSLITTMESDTFDDLAQLVTEAVTKGETDLAAVIRAKFGAAEARARLIARDQIAKLNGRITQDRQQELGVEAYEWSSSGDQRVRPKHRALDGTIRRWDDPHPTEGHPGSAIACRCVAIPIVDDELVPAKAAPVVLESPSRSEPPPGLPEHPAPPAPPSDRLAPEVEAELREVEAMIREKPEENGAFILGDGRRIDLTAEHTRDNGRDPRTALVLPRAAAEAARSDSNAILTHAHTNGSVLSPRDIQAAALLDLREVRATTPGGGAWVVRRPLAGWPNDTAIELITEARRLGFNRARMEMDALIRAAGGDPRDDQAAIGWDDDAWKRLHAWHVEAGIREGIADAGLVLEFEP